MGLQNKAFSIFNKCVGSARGFAMNHVFPVMKTDYMAARAGLTGIQRGIISGNFGPGFLGAGMEVGNIARRGFNATMGSYRGAGVSPLKAGLRVGAYGATGMWGLNKIVGSNE